MTPRERVRAALARHYQDPDFESKLGNCLTVLRTRVPYQEVPGRPGVQEDEFGVQWDRRVDTDIGTVCNAVVTPETLEQYHFPDSADARRFAHFAAALQHRGERFAIASLAFTMFERAWTLCGMETLLMAMIDDPDFAHALFDRILEFDLAITRTALSYDIDGMRFGDDWGQQRGLIIGPALWREYIRPRVSKLYGLVKSKGKRVFIHSCGQVEGLFPDLIDGGVDVFNPFQPEVMDVERLKARYGSRMTFFGGISTQKTLPFGTEMQVREEVKRLLDRIGAGGGYIAAPSHDIPKDSKPENIAAMLDVLRNQ